MLIELSLKTLDSRLRLGRSSHTDSLTETEPAGHRRRANRTLFCSPVRWRTRSATSYTRIGTSSSSGGGSLSLLRLLCLPLLGRFGSFLLLLLILD